MALQNIRILEGRNLLWDDISKFYKKNIVSEDYIILHEFDENRLKRLQNSKPFFSEYYVVELHLNNVTTRLTNSLIRYRKSDHIKYIYVVQNKDDYEALSTVCDKGFNGYKISFNYWSGYVRVRLNCSCQINLENVYKLLGGRFELTDIVIDTINKNDGCCSMKQMTKVIGKKEISSIDVIWFNIVLREEKNRSTVFKFLEDYRYGFRFIDKQLKDKFSEMLKLYYDFRDGKLNDVKFREYKKDSKFSTWKLQRYLDIFSIISFDEILLIGQIIECSKFKCSEDMFITVGKLYSRDYSGVFVYGE